MLETEEITTREALRTIDRVGQMIPHPHAGIFELFDTMPLKIVREGCLAKLSWYGDDLKWAQQRIRDSLEIDDFETVFMILRPMCIHGARGNQEEVFGFVVDVFEQVLERGGRFIKEISVIFCGYLKNHSDVYNERARALIKSVFSGGWGMSPDKERYRVLKRLILIVAYVRDAELLSEVRKFVMPLTYPALSNQGLDYKFKYLSVSEEEIEVDAHARQCVAYLEGLCRP